MEANSLLSSVFPEQLCIIILVFEYVTHAPHNFSQVQHVHFSLRVFQSITLNLFQQAN